jgi:hypothetical protein
VPFLEARYLLKVFHDFLLIFLHLDHFLPFPLSHVPHFSDSHDAYFLDVMVDFLLVQSLPFDFYRTLPVDLLAATLHQLPQFSPSFFCGHDRAVLLVEEINSLVGCSHSEVVFAHAYN